jgi:hypothetical protein
MFAFMPSPSFAGFIRQETASITNPIASAIPTHNRQTNTNNTLLCIDANRDLSLRARLPEFGFGEKGAAGARANM